VVPEHSKHVVEEEDVKSIKATLALCKTLHRIFSFQRLDEERGREGDLRSLTSQGDSPWRLERLRDLDIGNIIIKLLNQTPIKRLTRVSPQPVTDDFLFMPACPPGDGL
jgi:hypothetical protein